MANTTGYTSPADLVSMYVQLAQHQQASETFNRSLGLLAASAYPGRRPDIIMRAMEGQGQDAGGMIGNIIKLQEFNQQQQAYQAQMAAVPALAQQLYGDQSQESLMKARALVGSGQFGAIEANLAGVGGSPAWQAQKKAELALTQAGKPIPWTPGDPDSYNAFKIRTDKDAADKQKDLDADTANFQPALDAYDNMIKDAHTLIDPTKTPGLDDIVGGKVNSMKTKDTPLLANTTQQAIGLYDKIMGKQYASGVQDFHGAGRITQQELKQDLPGQSTMSNRQQSAEDFRQGVNDYIATLQQKRALLFGKAGQLANPALSDADYNSPSMAIYRPGGSLYAPNQRDRPASAAPAPAASPPVAAANNAGPLDLRTSKDPDGDYAKLPSGATFTGPDGKLRRKP
jgi:hypothetical protein